MVVDLCGVVGVGERVVGIRDLLWIVLIECCASVFEERV